MANSVELRDLARQAMRAAKAAGDAFERRRFSAEALKLAQLGEKQALAEAAAASAAADEAIHNGVGHLWSELKAHALLTQDGGESAEILRADVRRYRELLCVTSDASRARMEQLLAQAEADLSDIAK